MESKMGLIANEIDQYLVTHMVESIQRLPKNQAEVIVKEVCLTFNIERTKDLAGPAAMWLQLRTNATTVFLEGNIPNGWAKIAFLMSYPVYLLFEQHQDDSVYKCQNATDVQLLLSETSGFEFYLVDQRCKQIACFNFYDTLFLFKP
jgi:hypothetical protein